MRIKSLTLEGYIPFLTNNIQHFHIDFDSAYQIILGTNGSGKSRLLYEISPLPAAKNSYIKGGLKDIKIEDKGKNYTLRSDFSNGNDHSFIMHGENGTSDVELNPGGTYTIQKELVRQRFNYTQDLHEVLLGIEKFSTMPSMRRRQWIIDISGTDLDYAMGIFNKLKTQARDAAGAVKHLNHRITVETDKLLSQEALEELRATSDQIHQELTAMMEAREPGIRATDVLEQTIATSLQTISQISTTIFQVRLKAPVELGKVSSVGDVSDFVNKLQQERAINEAQLKSYQDEHHHLDDIIQALTASGVEGIDELVTKVNGLKAERTSLLNTIKGTLITDMVDGVCEETRDCASHLEDIVTELRGNEDGRYTKTRMEETRTSIDSLMSNRDKAIANLERVEHRINHIKGTDKTNCPKCGHVWMKGIRPGELSEFESKSNQIQVHITEMNAQILEAKTYLENAEQYQYQLRRFKRLTESYPKLKMFWDGIVEQKLYITSPMTILKQFETWRHDVKVSVEISAIDNKIAEYQHAIDYASQNKTDGNQFGARIQTLDERIEECTAKAIWYRATITKITAYQKDVQNVLTMAEKVTSLADNVGLLQDELIRSYKNSILQNTIRQHQTDLAKANEALVNARVAGDLVNDLVKDRDGVELDRDAYQLMADEMSPTDGIIADQLSQFIGFMTEQMNAIVRSVWTYDMVILPCGMESGELDYKFPLQVRNTDIPIADVSRGSAAQVDMIDFAFRLVVMLYLGLKNYPLHLDELTPTFDEQHRINIVRYIRELVENHQVTQLFLISHYHAQHGSFTNAQVCVMDTANILTIPNAYNKHVVMR